MQSSGCTRILIYIYIYIHRPNFGRTKRQRGCLLTYHKFGSNWEKHIYIYIYIIKYIYIYITVGWLQIMGVSENGDKAPSHGMWTAKWWYPRSCSQTPHFLSSPWKPPSLEEERPHTHTHFYAYPCTYTYTCTPTHTSKQANKQTERGPFIGGSSHKLLWSAQHQLSAAQGEIKVPFGPPNGLVGKI